MSEERREWQPLPDRPGVWWWLDGGRFPEPILIADGGKARAPHDSAIYSPGDLGGLWFWAGEDLSDIRPPLDTIYRCARCRKVCVNQSDRGAICPKCMALAPDEDWT